MAEQNNQAERAAPKFSLEQRRAMFAAFSECLTASMLPQEIADKLLATAGAALPASVDAEGLPQLPEPDHSLDCGMQPFYRPDQMQRYAKAAIAADRRKQAMMQPAPAAGTVEKDAARWRETLMHVGGTYTDVGAQRFTLRYLNPVEGADILKGSVAGHFTAAIDAVIEAHNRAGEEQR